MKYKMLLLFTAMLFYLTALLYTLSSTAFAGQGCGTNWMGDTTGDTDFYVSKNQNLVASSDMDSAPATAKPALALGSTATKVSQLASIQSLNPDKASPQAPGTAIVWTAMAANPGSGQLLYDFLRKGPSTGGQLKDETGWLAESTWTWNATDADVGENQVEVRVKHSGSQNPEDSKAVSYVIAAVSAGGEPVAVDTSATAADADLHPTSNTADSELSKPRVAPDEKRSTVEQSSDISGANMRMPDTKPTPLAQTDSTESTQVDEAVKAALEEPAESKVMDVDGKWNVRLANADCSMDLILVQAGKSVTGMGNLNMQNKKLPLILTGSVSSNSMALDVKTVVNKYDNTIDKRFNIDLVKVDRVISGSYEAYSGEDLTGMGNATASRFGG
jgi:hypothetical protein